METQIQTPTLSIDTAVVAVAIQPEVANGTALKEYAESFVISTDDDANAGAAWRNQVDQRIKAVQDKLSGAKAAAHRAHAEICRIESDAIAPLQQAKVIMNAKLVTYQAEVERLRRIEEARRLEEERKREEERRLAEAEALEAAGEKEMAAAVIDEPQVFAPPPPPVKAQVRGVTFRETWSATVVSKLLLLKAVVENPSLINLLDVNMTALNSMARAQKEHLRIPGVKVVCSKQVATARRG